VAGAVDDSDENELRAETAEEGGDFLSAFIIWGDLASKERDPFFFTRCGRAAQEIERWDDAEMAFAEALRVDPTFGMAMEGMGDLWATRTDKDDKESFEIAKSWFLKALQRERKARTLTFLGATYRALAEEAAAQQAFSEALQLNPDYEEALYNLAKGRKESDPANAIELLERAISIDPDYFLAHQELGTLYHRAGDLPRAEYHFRRSLEIEPWEFFSLLFLANLLSVTGRDAEAEETYRKAIQLYPEKLEGYEFFANFLDSVGKSEEASSLRQRAKSTS